MYFVRSSREIPDASAEKGATHLRVAQTIRRVLSLASLGRPHRHPSAEEDGWPHCSPVAPLLAGWRGRAARPDAAALVPPELPLNG